MVRAGCPVELQGKGHIEYVQVKFQIKPKRLFGIFANTTPGFHTRKVTKLFIIFSVKKDNNITIAEIIII